MNVVFRVDSEKSILGTGHIHRCLNLAEELRRQNFKISFLIRKFDGHLGRLLIKKKFKVFFLKKKKIKKLFLKNKKIYKKKIQIEEAKKTLKTIKDTKKNFLIIDHYFLDKTYESYIKNYFDKIIVIDDLANRKHECDILLDQNFSFRNEKKYKKYLSSNVNTLFGPSFALVGKTFKKFRNIKIKKKNKINNILLFMGGSDPTNETIKALEGVNLSNLKFKIINIVVGSSYNYVGMLKRKLNKVNFNYKIYIQTTKMAELLRRADLAIISGGFITWEKCVVGTPSLVTIKSKNQYENCRILEKKGAHMILGKSNNTTSLTYAKKLKNLKISNLNLMKIKSRKICDGNGVLRVVKKMRLLIK